MTRSEDRQTTTNKIPGMAQSVAKPVSPAALKLIGHLNEAQGCARAALQGLIANDMVAAQEATVSLWRASEDAIKIMNEEPEFYPKGVNDGNQDN